MDSATLERIRGRAEKAKADIDRQPEGREYVGRYDLPDSRYVLHRGRSVRRRED